MFIIVPAIIIFLALSYLHVNDDVSLVIEVIIYIFSLTIFLLSLYLYRSFQKSLQQQEINKILLEIQNLNKELKKTKDISQQKLLTQKINKLKQETKKTPR